MIIISHFRSNKYKKKIYWYTQMKNHDFRGQRRKNKMFELSSRVFCSFYRAYIKKAIASRRCLRVLLFTQSALDFFFLRQNKKISSRLCFFHERRKSNWKCIHNITDSYKKNTGKEQYDLQWNSISFFYRRVMHTKTYAVYFKSYFSFDE
jgi:hypothetical protein